MDKKLLQTMIVFIFCGAVFGVDSEISWMSRGTRPDFSRIPANPTTSDRIEFIIPTDVFNNHWEAEKFLGGTPTLVIDTVQRRIDIKFLPPVPEDPIPSTYDPVSGLEGYFGPLEEGSWLFFAQFQGVIYIDPFDVGPSSGNPPTNDYFTEHFVTLDDAFDLTYQSVRFNPTPDGLSYTAEIRQISELPTDPAGGINLGLGNDASRFVKLVGPAAVSIYGNRFTGFYVGSNGYITFTEGDRDYSESLQDHFDTLRVSGLFRNLNPSAGGQVSWKQLADRAVVTWKNVPEYGRNNSNTFQIALYYDGAIELSWEGVDVVRAIVGLSDGHGVRPDFEETDFSELSAPSVSDYLVEQFTSDGDDFDLANTSITLDPVAGGTAYKAKVQDISQLPTNPSGGTNLALGDDDFSFVKLVGPAMVSLYGNSFSGFYVGSNGYITLTEGDRDYSESLEDHFDTLRISGLFRDLNPTAGGRVSWKNMNDRVAVTWLNVPLYGANGPNTFQIELFFDGRLRLSWLQMAARIGIVGLSDGAGVPPDFQETDLSELSVKPPITDFLTEQFVTSSGNPFDLEYTSVMFTPTADGTSYTGSLQSITHLPTNPAGGTNLGLTDDIWVRIGFTNNARIKIFNQSYSSIFVGSNGYITFTRGDTDYSETLAEHFETLRIAGLYTDLTAAHTGSVSGKQLSNRVAITWLNVPVYGNSAPNTFQIEMYYDGRIRLSWLEIGSRSNIVGLSNGQGLPPDFEETDFSVRYAQP